MICYDLQTDILSEIYPTSIFKILCKKWLFENDFNTKIIKQKIIAGIFGLIKIVSNKRQFW